MYVVHTVSSATSTGRRASIHSSSAGGSEFVVLRQESTQMSDVAGRQSERVQLRQLRVCRHPRQRRLEAGERAAQHSHPGALSLVGRIPRWSSCTVALHAALRLCSPARASRRLNKKRKQNRLHVNLVKDRITLLVCIRQVRRILIV